MPAWGAGLGGAAPRKKLKVFDKGNFDAAGVRKTAPVFVAPRRVSPPMTPPSKASYASLITLLVGAYFLGPDCGYMTHLAYHNYNLIHAFYYLKVVLQLELLLATLYAGSLLFFDAEHTFDYYWTKWTWNEIAATEKEAENKAMREAREALRNSRLGSSIGKTGA